MAYHFYWHHQHCHAHPLLCLLCLTCTKLRFFHRIRVPYMIFYISEKSMVLGFHTYLSFDKKKTNLLYWPVIDCGEPFQLWFPSHWCLVNSLKLLVQCTLYADTSPNSINQFIWVHTRRWMWVSIFQHIFSFH